MCRDTHCTDGITWCPGCNGWGVLNPKGKKYRQACRQIPPWAVAHDACGGTGLRACGCVELRPDELAVLARTA